MGEILLFSGADSGRSRPVTRKKGEMGRVVLFRSWSLIIYLLSVGTMFQLIIVLYEEPHLRREFGGEYDDYRARVPRWLLGIRS